MIPYRIAQNVLLLLVLKRNGLKKLKKEENFAGNTGCKRVMTIFLIQRQSKEKRKSPGAPLVLLGLLCAIDALVFGNFIQFRYMIEVAPDHKHACEPGIVIAFHSSSKGHGISH